MRLIRTPHPPQELIPHFSNTYTIVGDNSVSEGMIPHHSLGDDTKIVEKKHPAQFETNVVVYERYNAPCKMSVDGYAAVGTERGWVYIYPIGSMDWMEHEYTQLHVPQYNKIVGIFPFQNCVFVLYDTGRMYQIDIEKDRVVWSGDVITPQQFLMSSKIVQASMNPHGTSLSFWHTIEVRNSIQTKLSIVELRYTKPAADFEAVSYGQKPTLERLEGIMFAKKDVINRSNWDIIPRQLLWSGDGRLLMSRYSFLDNTVGENVSVFEVSKHEHDFTVTHRYQSSARGRCDVLGNFFVIPFRGWVTVVDALNTHDDMIGGDYSTTNAGGSCWAFVIRDHPDDITGVYANAQCNQLLLPQSEKEGLVRIVIADSGKQIVEVEQIDTDPYEDVQVSANGTSVYLHHSTAVNNRI